MSKQIPISRRGVLASSLFATAPAASAVASTRAAPGPDALLMDVLARYWQAERGILAMEAAPEPPLTATAYPVWESKLDTLIAARAQAISQMADIRAMTAEGRRSKAQIVERCLPSSVRWGDGSLDTPEIRLALSLARDMAA